MAGSRDFFIGPIDASRAGGLANSRAGALGVTELYPPTNPTLTLVTLTGAAKAGPPRLSVQRDLNGPL